MGTKRTADFKAALNRTSGWLKSRRESYEAFWLNRNAIFPVLLAGNWLARVMTNIVEGEVSSFHERSAELQIPQLRRA